MPSSNVLQPNTTIGRDVTLLAPTLPDEPLPWQHIVSIQFALHYAFKSKASARSFLHNATGRLCGGGLLIITTVDSSKIGEFARQAAEKQENMGLDGRVSLPRLAAGKQEFGLGYRFDLTGEGIDCEEYVVHESLLGELLEESHMELQAAIPFEDLEKSGLASDIAASLLSRLPGDFQAMAAMGDFGVYDRLGLKVSREEACISSLYKQAASANDSIAK
eukprot:g25458.t1